MNRAMKEALRETEKGRALLAATEAAKRARASRVKAKPRAAGLSRADRNEIANRETARIRAVVKARSGGVGELCGQPLGETWELCHLDGGSGKRRTMQTTRNCVAEHHDCHQGVAGLDRRPLLWLAKVKAWAAKYDYPVPFRFHKLEALRSAPSEKGRSLP